VKAAAPPPGGATRVATGDAAVAVFEVEGQLVAFDDRCLHRGGSLSGGLVHGAVVTCPEHWWRYDLRSGERLGSPGVCLRRYPVVREGATVLVGIPPGPPVASIREALLRHAREWERGG
jgi:nitrite reductase/ring-hydroxylating ferredoxin subunit